MKKKLFQRLAVIAGSVAASASAFAVDPTSASEAMTQVQASATGFGPAMWGLAAATVGILIGVKWIKRGRGAA